MLNLFRAICEISRLKTFVPIRKNLFFRTSNERILSPINTNTSEYLPQKHKVTATAPVDNSKEKLIICYKRFHTISFVLSPVFLSSSSSFIFSLLVCPYIRRQKINCRQVSWGTGNRQLSSDLKNCFDRNIIIFKMNVNPQQFENMYDLVFLERWLWRVLSSWTQRHAVLESQQMFQRNMSRPSSGSKNNPSRKQAWSR
jgi:hypothetical protein